MLSRQMEFEKLWEGEGHRLLDTTEAITGKTFRPQEITARLTLCDIPSETTGMNVVINMRYALKSFTPSPVSVRYKVETLFHELLHVFLTQNPVGDSVLLKEHAAEPERTRDHLHLLALQKAVLLRLHEDETLQETIAVDSELPGGYYKRAWEIVNANDTAYLNYVAEIRARAL
jgi:hypothetical protein